MRATHRVARRLTSLSPLNCRSLFWLALIMVAAPLLGCDDGASNTMADVPTVPDDTAPGPDTPQDAESDATTDSTDPGDLVAVDGDALADVSRPLPELSTRAPVSAPPDPLAGTNVESCSVFNASRCTNGTNQTCRIYDTSGASFLPDAPASAGGPDPVFAAALVADRRYDLYHNASGLTAERVFNREMLPSATEAEWGSPDAFERYVGRGDAAIWNGAALLAFAMRYLNTGTEADYARMETKLRDMLLQFDVTGIPGYLARYHFLMVDPAAPNDDRYQLNHGAPEDLDHNHRVMESPASIEGLPDIYTQGFTATDGTVWNGTPMWKGHPSIDQYSGPRTAFPIVYPLLRDESLKARMVEHMTCYLKRLERIEIINLQSDPELLVSLQGFFAGNAPQLDPDDIDFTTLDTIVMYVHPQLTTLNEDTFDRSCPDSVQLEPSRVIDIARGNYLLDVIDLVGDMRSEEQERSRGIDHFYVPSIRGGDAMNLMHLATIAYHWTGDDQYRRFLFHTLVEDVDAIGVAHTAGAFNLPEYCRRFYGHHIGFSPIWSFLTMLEDSELRREIERVYEIEMWQKEVRTHDNAKFNLMYAGAVSPDVAVDRDAAIATANQKLDEFGALTSPRRTYSVDTDALIARMQAAGNDIRCPSETERAQCEDGIEVLGIAVPGDPITSTCTGAAWECPMQNGTCAEAMSRDALPIADRRYADFAWQRNPFDITGSHGIEGQKQSPGLDFMEEYWLARYYDFRSDGAGQVLAWMDDGACN